MTLANSPSAMAEGILAIIVAGCSMKDHFSRQWLAEGGRATILNRHVSSEGFPPLYPDRPFILRVSLPIGQCELLRFSKNSESNLR
jgi:hypothetical protein